MGSIGMGLRMDAFGRRSSALTKPNKKFIAVAKVDYDHIDQNLKLSLTEKNSVTLILHKQF